MNKSKITNVKIYLFVLKPESVLCLYNDGYVIQGQEVGEPIPGEVYYTVNANIYKK